MAASPDKQGITWETRTRNKTQNPHRDSYWAYYAKVTSLPTCHADGRRTLYNKVSIVNIS